MTDTRPETVAETVARLRRVSLDLGFPSITKIDSARVREIADMLEALAARLAEARDALSGRTFTVDEGREWKAKAEALAARLAEVEADSADLRVNMDADLKTMCREGAALKAAEARVAELEAEVERLRTALSDAADHLDYVHSDAMKQVAGMALCVSDGRSFSHMALNECQSAALRARRALAGEQQ